MKTNNKSRKTGRKLRIPRDVPGQTVMITRSMAYNIGFAADPAYGFGFSPTNLWVNGASSTAIGGVSEITALFELCRIAKVEITWLPGNQALDWGSNSVTTGIRNIPYVLESFDPRVSTTPTISGLLETSGVSFHSANEPFSKVIHPVLLNDAGIVPVGRTNRESFVATGVDVPWNGWNVIMDLTSTALTYCSGQFYFKIFYECKSVR